MYMRFSKDIVRVMLEDETSMSFKRFTAILALITLVSVCATASESVPRFAEYRHTFILIEWITVALFTFEYGARLWIADRRMQYAFSFLGIIDLASILPTLLGLSSLAFLKTARLVRMLRLMRIVGRVNVGHVHHHGKLLTERYTFRLQSLLMMLVLSTFVCIYVFHVHVMEFPLSQLVETLEVFIGVLATPDSTTGGITALILGRFLGALTIGLLFGYVIERMPERE